MPDWERDGPCRGSLVGHGSAAEAASRRQYPARLPLSAPPPRPVRCDGDRAPPRPCVGPATQLAASDTFRTAAPTSSAPSPRLLPRVGPAMALSNVPLAFLTVRTPWCSTSRGAEHDRARERHRRPHHAPCGLRREPAQAQAGGGDLRLAQDGGPAPQGPPPRSRSRRLDVPLQPPCSQPAPDAQSTGGHVSSARRRIGSFPTARTPGFGWPGRSCLTGLLVTAEGTSDECSSAACQRIGNDVPPARAERVNDSETAARRV